MKGDERREEVTRNRWRERREGRGCGEERRKRSVRAPKQGGRDTSESVRGEEDSVLFLLQPPPASLSSLTRAVPASRLAPDAASNQIPRLTRRKLKASITSDISLAHDQAGLA